MATASDANNGQQELAKAKPTMPVATERRQDFRAAEQLANHQSRSTNVDLRRSRDEADYVTAFRLVKKAADTIDTLQDRCRRLEVEVREMNARLKSEADASERVILDWERLANAFKVQLAKGEEALADAVANAKMLEEKAAGLTERAMAAEARANAAEQLATDEGALASTFRDKILESFGSGSPLANALAVD